LRADELAAVSPLLLFVVWRTATRNVPQPCQGEKVTLLGHQVTQSRTSLCHEHVPPQGRWQLRFDVV